MIVTVLPGERTKPAMSEIACNTNRNDDAILCGAEQSDEDSAMFAKL